MTSITSIISNIFISPFLGQLFGVCILMKLPRILSLILTPTCAGANRILPGQDALTLSRDLDPDCVLLGLMIPRETVKKEY